MLGRDHALLAAVAAVGLGEPLAHLTGTKLPPGQLAAATVVTAAFALLPDIDEPGSTVARKLGPLSEIVAVITNKLAGGHRKATHSILFAAAITLAVWAGARFALTAPIVVYASLALTLTMLIPARLVRKGSGVALLAPIAAGLAVWKAETGGWWARMPGGPPVHLWKWLPVAALAGVVLHIVGDMLTAMGAPVIWPIDINVAVPILGHTESLRESLLGASLSLGLLALTWFEIVSPLLPGRVGA